MSTTRYCPVNHHDTRGVIRDIYGSGAPDAVTLITQRAGSVRGNHVHARSTQHLFVVSGAIVAYTRAAPGIGQVVERVGLGAGMLITHGPGEAHAYRAVVDSVLLAFADGVRKGEAYEDDTCRIPDLIAALDEEWGENAPPMRGFLGDPW